jgi:predicted alpha/beta hydrolase family esterase
MKRAIIIHGWDFTPKMNWYPWLKKELELKGYEVVVPEMPNSPEPKIEEWINKLKTLEIDNNTLLISHSIGCQAIIRFLEKENFTVNQAVFVAGWFKLDNLENEEVEQIAKPWLQMPNLTNIKGKIKNLTVFLSSNEPFGCIEENKNLFNKIGAKVIVLEDKGHFTKEDGIIKVPEILQVIK